MRQMLGPGALGRPRGIGWRGRWEGGSGWGIQVNPWLIHVNVWQKPLQYCKVISFQLIIIKKKLQWDTHPLELLEMKDSVLSVFENVKQMVEIAVRNCNITLDNDLPVFLQNRKYSYPVTSNLPWRNKHTFPPKIFHKRSQSLYCIADHWK